jgi:tRNA threonylcarbamoyladenosine biosynthesis protein TsaE
MEHMPILGTRRQHWHDETACEQAAARLSLQHALRDARIELVGPLGAGKTSFVRHLLRALGVRGRIKSPSYAIVEPYEIAQAHGGGASFAASHFDFYRFEDPHEWDDAGLRDDYAAPGLKLVEWPEKAGALLPAPDLRLSIAPQPDGARDVTWQAHTERGLAMLPEAGA